MCVRRRIVMILYRKKKMIRSSISRGISGIKKTQNYCKINTLYNIIGKNTKKKKNNEFLSKT